MRDENFNDQKTRTKVTINGHEYTVKAAYSSDKIKEIAEFVDGKMQEIKRYNPNLNPSKLAVLTALNLSDELFELKSEYENLLQLIEEEKKN